MAQQRARARQKRQRMVIMLLLLLVVGAAVAFILNSNADSKIKKPRPKPKGVVAIPVAKKNLPLGTRLSKKSVRMLYRSPREVPTNAILSQDQYLGRFITKPILAGQYISQGDVSTQGAVGGYSAMAKPGMRLITLDARKFTGALHTLKVGDRIDLLAFQSSRTNSRRNGRKVNSAAVSGNQPGGRSPRPKTRSNNMQRALFDPGSASATLIAENAEVMSVPKLNRLGRPMNRMYNFIVLQMHPQDAHITTLMAASGAKLSTVFRPYGDTTRLTQPKAPSITTRSPKSISDPDIVHLIANGKTYLTKPNSTIFIDAETESQQTNTNNPTMIYGKSRAVEVVPPDSQQPVSHAPIATPDSNRQDGMDRTNTKSGSRMKLVKVEENANN